MTTWIESHKPAAGARAHLVAAGVMWSVVGIALAGVGVSWTWESTPAAAAWLTAAAVVVGATKSWLVLDHAARRIVARISARGDGRCLGGFLSPGTWGLVMVMMIAGRLLRGTFAHPVVGPLYLAIGTALLVSSRVAWRAWQEMRPKIG
ncbi:MAG: hypothetical protein P8127_15295 [Acidobacteriota bacterium]